MTTLQFATPARQRARTWSKTTYALFTLPWLLPGAVAGYAAHEITAKPAAQFEPAAVAVAPQKAFPGARISYSGSGTFQVPGQVAPGTYMVTASGLTFGCAWERLKSVDDKPKSVIDSGAVNRGTFGQFTVSPSDKLLRLSGDCTWARL